MILLSNVSFTEIAPDRDKLHDLEQTHSSHRSSGHRPRLRGVPAKALVSPVRPVRSPTSLQWPCVERQRLQSSRSCAPDTATRRLDYKGRSIGSCSYCKSPLPFLLSTLTYWILFTHVDSYSYLIDYVLHQPEPSTILRPETKVKKPLSGHLPTNRQPRLRSRDSSSRSPSPSNRQRRIG